MCLVTTEEPFGKVSHPVGDLCGYEVRLSGLWSNWASLLVESAEQQF
jgi:hypothetical protein